MVDKTQLEKRVDALEAKESGGGSGGVGRNVGGHNEIFNVNEGEADNNIIRANSDYNHAEGYGNTIQGSTNYNHAEGRENTIQGMGFGNHAEGSGNTMNGCQTTSIGGYGNSAQNCRAFVIQGDNIKVTGTDTHDSSGIIGQSITVSNRIQSGSLVLGVGSDVLSPVSGSIVSGHNIEINGSGVTSSLILGNYLTLQGEALNCLVIGSGISTVSSSHRINMFDNGQLEFAVDRDGNAYARQWQTIGADYAEMFEWADGNPANEDRRGMLVTLSGDKIIPAHGDDFIGIISANPSVIGNNPLHWHGKYKTDVFGSVIYDDNGDAVLSDEYDPKQEYIPRSERPEWAAVGLTGRLVVVNDGSCIPGAFVSARQGTATKCYKNTGARVLRRIDETHVEVMLK